MERILFISSRPIYPIVGGDQIRTAQQLNFLVQHYEVDVLYLSEHSDGEDLVKQNIPSVNKVICFKLSRLRSYIHTLCFLFNRLPLQVNYYYDSKVAQYVKSHRAEYDLIFCNNIRTAEYARRIKGVRKAIDFVDAISMNYEKAMKHAHGLKKLIYAIDYKRCKRYEQCILSSFDNCAIISEVDKQYILKCQQNSMS